MLGACNTCERLQSRVTSSGATVNSRMIWFHCFYFYFVCLFGFVGFLLLFSAFVSVCAFKFVLLLSLLWFLFVVSYFILFLFLLLFFSFVSLFLVPERSAVFISMWVGVGCSYNHLLVRKLTFLILKLYINLKCDREVWL